jgi:hypothetical protein
MQISKSLRSDLQIQRLLKSNQKLLLKEEALTLWIDNRKKRILLTAKATRHLALILGSQSKRKKKSIRIAGQMMEKSK